MGSYCLFHTGVPCLKDETYSESFAQKTINVLNVNDLYADMCFIVAFRVFRGLM